MRLCQKRLKNTQKPMFMSCRVIRSVTAYAAPIKCTMITPILFLPTIQPTPDGPLSMTHCRAKINCVIGRGSTAESFPLLTRFTGVMLLFASARHRRPSDRNVSSWRPIWPWSGPLREIKECSFGDSSTFFVVFRSGSISSPPPAKHGSSSR